MDEGDLWLLYGGIGLGVPLLMLEAWCRHTSGGRKGVFGTILALIASFF
ncbi:MAG TPA: hypothetical protein VNN17_03250 [Terriglobia bacterium]|nr:hypothetical protein [Terriglobia bacterium]